MRKLFLCTLFLFYLAANAQEPLPDNSSRLAANIQYAGSIGFYSLGISRIFRDDEIELGLLFGYVPRFADTPLGSIVLKFLYNPFHFEIVKKIEISPLQTGTFLSQNFGNHLDFSWGRNYPRGYYWWQRSLRAHFFVSSQLSYKTGGKNLNKVSWYLEANTNDLYLYSFFPNMRSIRIHDIFFLGTGIKLYIK